MKTKIILTVLYICFTLIGCKEEIPECDNWTNHNGVEYKIDGIWTPVHDMRIDISDMPNDFILEFKTFGVDSVKSIDNDTIKITILDPIERECKYGPILNEPFEYVEKQWIFKYIQKFHFKTNGEKELKVKFFYIWNFPNDCTCTLIRQ